MKKNLGIIFFNSIDLELGTYLIKKFKLIFKNKFTLYNLIEETLEIPLESYNQEINQYFAPNLLDQLRSYAIENNYYKILGIIPDVLYSKWCHYLYGQAEFGDEMETKASIISSIRIMIELDPVDKQNMYFKRILKESIHEIGHTLNLDHCENDCVMKISESLSDIDKKPYNYCLSCKAKLNID